MSAQAVIQPQDASEAPHDDHRRRDGVVRHAHCLISDLKDRQDRRHRTAGGLEPIGAPPPVVYAPPPPVYYAPPPPPVVYAPPPGISLGVNIR